MSTQEVTSMKEKKNLIICLYTSPQFLRIMGSTLNISLLQQASNWTGKMQAILHDIVVA